MLYQKEEFLELKNIVGVITLNNVIPENQASYIWNHYKKVVGTNENQPCGKCGSQAKHWKKAVDVLRDYIQNNSQFYLT